MVLYHKLYEIPNVFYVNLRIFFLLLGEDVGKVNRKGEIPIMQGFYLLTMQRVRRRKRIVCAAGAAALLSLLLAFHAQHTVSPAMAETPPPLPYIAVAEGDRLIVRQDGKTILRTAIDIRSLPSADRAALAQGIEVADMEALAKLLEDYGS